ncbi:hypothetical protein WR25_18753 [Diploscapter pachys]|uniref:PH domain-containing protein n=1 Tax=Diploscapter pachys TaxID=2018661 RepID=A0A2A2KSR0_9BILA|nr:hypothetical protein WR25_18753 [Diploscapter pachys]
MALVAQGRSSELAYLLPTLSKALHTRLLQANHATIVKIMGNVGRCSKDLAAESVTLFMDSLPTTDSNLESQILTEIDDTVSTYPSSIAGLEERIRAVGQQSLCKKIIERILSYKQHSNSQIDFSSHSILIDGRNDSASLQHAISKDSSIEKRPDSNSNSNFRRPSEVSAEEYAIQQLDRNIEKMMRNGHYNNYKRMMEEREGRSASSATLNNNNKESDEQFEQPQFLAGPSQATDILFMCRDGRVRPAMANRRPLQFPRSETTFPAQPGPVITMRVGDISVEDTVAQPDRSDVVQQFVEHRKNKIRRYISEIHQRFPIPIQCTVEASKNSKHRMLVHFACQNRSSFCAFPNDSLFAFKTKQPSLWLHLMFLQMQSCFLDERKAAAGRSSQAFQTLSHCWTCLPNSIRKNREFTTLVTSAFPNSTDQEKLLKELEETLFFDNFTFDSANNKWNCFSCSNPDKVRILEGQLKEKKTRYKLFKRWKTKYFTLSSAALSSSCDQDLPASNNNNFGSGIDLRSIRSVRSLSRGKRSRKSLRKAIQIFTDCNTSLILKANDEKKAQEWLQCLQIAVAHAKREPSIGERF